MIEFRNKKKLTMLNERKFIPTITANIFPASTHININTSSSNQNHRFDVHEQINSLNQVSQWHTNYHIF